MKRTRFRSVPVIAAASLGMTVIGGMGYFGDTAQRVALLPGWLVWEDLLAVQAPDPWWIVLFGLVSWALWFTLAWALVGVVAGDYRRSIAVGSIAVLAMGYVMFRSSTWTRDNGEVHRFHRTWGFVTRVTVDSDGDGRIDYEDRYRWRDPYIDPHVGDPISGRRDANLDGLWDTWIDYRLAHLTIDTNGDEVPDMTLRLDSDGLARARQIRGY